VTAVPQGRAGVGVGAVVVGAGGGFVVVVAVVVVVLLLAGELVEARAADRLPGLVPQPVAAMPAPRQSSALSPRAAA
jgi:hypothetical protein